VNPFAVLVGLGVLALVFGAIAGAGRGAAALGRGTGDAPKPEPEPEPEPEPTPEPVPGPSTTQAGLCRLPAAAPFDIRTKCQRLTPVNRDNTPTELRFFAAELRARGFGVAANQMEGAATARETFDRALPDGHPAKFGW
jgi:hypothetical protein